MIKYNNLNRNKYNNLGSSVYNSRTSTSRREPLFNKLSQAMLVVYDQEDKRLGVLENADEPILEQEVEGVDILTFELPYNDPKAQYVENENIIEVVDRRYVIRRVKKRRTASDLYMEVYCEATWYDLQQTEPMEVWEWVNETPQQMMLDMLYGTDWNVGKVTVTNRRNLSLAEGYINRLQALKELPNIFDGELVFNTNNNTIDFVEQTGRDSGASIVYSKNMEDIEHEYSTENITTKLFLYGKDNMTIEDAHPEGKPFLENYSFTDKTRVTIMSDERFSNPYHLYERGVNALEILSKPTSSYVIKLSILSSLSGLEHEEFFLGDNVWVFDTELDINTNSRIMSWKYNLNRPWDTEIELESKHPTLSSLLSGIQEGSGFLQSEDSVARDEMLNLSVFNHLLNSRADDGFSYWNNRGWEIDPVNGFSGNSSFRVVGEPGAKKELNQTVYPSHREAYAISLRASTDRVVLGAGGRVGVEIKVKYEDGTEDESVFIPLVQEE